MGLKTSTTLENLMVGVDFPIKVPYLVKPSRVSDLSDPLRSNINTREEREEKATAKSKAIFCVFVAPNNQHVPRATVSFPVQPIWRMPFGEPLFHEIRGSEKLVTHLSRRTPIPMLQGAL
jgi:hypothetical protein